ncbi:MAG: hypothetical protein HRT61_21425 [Ekhidna sp.]|nr:hypothetical protein [Ekhidna sp.]
MNSHPKGPSRANWISGDIANLEKRVLANFKPTTRNPVTYLDGDLLVHTGLTESLISWNERYPDAIIMFSREEDVLAASNICNQLDIAGLTLMCCDYPSGRIPNWEPEPIDSQISRLFKSGAPSVPQPRAYDEDGVFGRCYGSQSILRCSVQ